MSVQGLYFCNPLVRWSLLLVPRQFPQSNLKVLNVTLLNTDREYILKSKQLEHFQPRRPLLCSFALIGSKILLACYAN